MGTHCSSEYHRGHISKSKSITMKLLLLTALAAIAMAEPEADAYYYGYNPGFYGYNRFYGHQQNWPSFRTYGMESTCWGCRGKRSADADAEPAYPYGSYGYNFGSYGYPYGSFNNFYGSYGYPTGFYGYSSYGRGIAAHPTGSSFTYRSVQGFGK